MNSMGICLGTGTSVTDNLDTDGRFVPANYADYNDLPERLSTAARKLGGASASVRFSEPRVPVILVLGGPGSGKITHCDRVVAERPGLAHVNMTDLIQQHLVGNGLDDFMAMSPASLCQVLMMEIKLAVTATCYLVSGYPRSMRDVVEYGKKLHRIDKVILLNWHVRILEKQIEFGSQLGDTVLHLARLELKNYTKNVLAVAEYFDQLKKLVVVDGERQPNDVYVDFLRTVDEILAETHRAKQATIAQLRSVEDSPTPGLLNRSFQNAVGGAVTGRHQIRNEPILSAGLVNTLGGTAKSKGGNSTPGTTKFGNSKRNTIVASSSVQDFRHTKIVWSIGGPGSNKSVLTSTYVQVHNPSWHYLSVGSELRFIIAEGVGGTSDLNLTSDQILAITTAVNHGELVSSEIVVDLILSRLSQLLRESDDKRVKLVVDGFPRNTVQMRLFEEKTGLHPSCMLLDCSESELGQSLGQRTQTANQNRRNDDLEPGAVKRRLEIYRVVTLPTLKILDDQQRLHIVDGDTTDKTQLVSDFNVTLGNIFGALEEGPRSEQGTTRFLNANHTNKGPSSRKRASTDTILRGMYAEIEQDHKGTAK